jgi:hypothetical protein
LIARKDLSLKIQAQQCSAVGAIWVLVPFGFCLAPNQRSHGGFRIIAPRVKLAVSSSRNIDRLEIGTVLELSTRRCRHVQQ